MSRYTALIPRGNRIINILETYCVFRRNKYDFNDAAANFRFAKITLYRIKLTCLDVVCVQFVHESSWPPAITLFHSSRNFLPQHYTTAAYETHYRNSR